MVVIRMCCSRPCCHVTALLATPEITQKIGLVSPTKQERRIAIFHSVLQSLLTCNSPTVAASHFPNDCQLEIKDTFGSPSKKKGQVQPFLFFSLGIKLYTFFC